MSVPRAISRSSRTGSTRGGFLTLRDDKIVKASAFFDSIAFDDLWNRVAP